MKYWTLLNRYCLRTGPGLPWIVVDLDRTLDRVTLSYRGQVSSPDPESDMIAAVSKLIARDTVVLYIR